VRRLLRGRHGTRHHLIVALAVAVIVTGESSHGQSEPAPPAIQITSPLGRSGLPGRVRIVARIAEHGDELPSVRFFVDGTLLGTDTDGAPFAIEWDDDNPFEKRVLSVEFDAPGGAIERDEVELTPFEFIDVARVMSVGVDATVQDAKGRFVGGLTATDFQLLENGIPQTLDSVRATATPATFALLIDSSQSMSRNMDFVRLAAGRFAKYLRDVDEMVVAPFADKIINLTGPTRDEATISEAVTAIRSKGGTAIMDALAEVSGGFAEGEGRRVVVLLTDAYDEKSLGDPELVLEKLKNSRVTVFVVSIGGVAGVSNRGERLLRKIAHETGGKAFFPYNEKQLAEVHAAIAEDVQHEYQLTYTPQNQTEDGTWREITLLTSDPKRKIRARTGYRAPMPPPVRASIEFTAIDAGRQWVELSKDDIEVSEDGVPQKVDVFNEAVAPVSIMLALDSSGSMTKAAASVQEAARTFVSALRPDDPLGVITFANEAEMAHDLSTNRALSNAAIGEYVARGGTALYDALTESFTRLRSVEGRRVVVVLTDGRDENASSNGPGSQHSWDDVVAVAKEVDATVYAIGLGSNLDRDKLEQLAALTGGESYVSEDVTALEQQYRRIVEELHRRYVLAYTSTNSKRDGAWRDVEIRTKVEGLQVRSRGGYSAPSQ
jgi:Ca-activated chloride channel family protein